MDAAEIRTICQERLGSWTEDLVKLHSTPLLMLGVGHDGKSGEISLIVVEDPIMNDKAVSAFLKHALKQLETGNITRV